MSENEKMVASNTFSQRTGGGEGRQGYAFGAGNGCENGRGTGMRTSGQVTSSLIRASQS